MRVKRLAAGLAVVVVTSVLVHGQAPPAPGAAKPDEPAIGQLRRAVADVRGNRIAVPSDYDALTPQQQAYVRSILTGPRSSISAPLGVMLVSPALGDLAQKAMAYARFAGQDGFSSVPPKLNELAILIVAKHWSADYVWNAHQAYAVRMGLAPGVVEAIRAGTRPAGMDRDVEAVYDFATELVTTRRVGDGTLKAAKTVLGGDRGVVDLVGTMGLYQLASMMVVVDETPVDAASRR